MRWAHHTKCEVFTRLTLAEMITTGLVKLSWTRGQNTCYSNDEAGKMLQMIPSQCLGCVISQEDERETEACFAQFT